MKRNDPPQMAPSSVSSSGVRQDASWAAAAAPEADTVGAEDAAAAAAGAAAVVVHSDADMGLETLRCRFERLGRVFSGANEVSGRRPVLPVLLGHPQRSARCASSCLTSLASGP